MIVYVRVVDSDVGSVTVARQLPVASGSDAAMAEVPPTFWVPLGQLTCMVRYVEPDQTTEICIAPVPVKPTLLERCAGGSMTPWCWVVPGGGAATVVVVVVTGGGAKTVTTVVVVTTGNATPPPVTAACVEVSAVAPVWAATVVVVVDREVDPAPAAAEPLMPCVPLDRKDASPRALPGPRFGLPAVATRSAIKARDTARMTHQFGRLGR